MDDMRNSGNESSSAATALVEDAPSSTVGDGSRGPKASMNLVVLPEVLDLKMWVNHGLEGVSNSKHAKKQDIFTKTLCFGSSYSYIEL